MSRLASQILTVLGIIASFAAGGLTCSYWQNAKSETVLQELPPPDGSLRVLGHTANMPCAITTLDGHAVLKLTLPPDYQWDVAVRLPGGGKTFFTRRNLSPGATLAIDPRSEPAFDGGKGDPKILLHPMFELDGDYRIYLTEDSVTDHAGLIDRGWCAVRYKNPNPVNPLDSGE